MPEGVGYGPQFTLNTGLTLNYIGKRVYAYSGIVGVTNSEKTLIETQTPNEVIKMRWEWNYTNTSDAITTDDYTFFFYLNDILVTAVTTDVAARFNEASNYKMFLVPPLTTIKITAVNKTGATVNNCYSSLIGKIVV